MSDSSVDTAPHVGADRRRRLPSLSGLGHRVDAFIIAITVASLAVCNIVISQELSRGSIIGDTALFAVVAVLLVITEVRSTAVVHQSSGGAVTPSWAFTFSLLLLGSPTWAILLTAFATLTADISARKPFVKVLFNTVQICLSLGLGALVLSAFGVHGPLFDDIALSTQRSIALIASGVVIFVTNGLIICRLLSLIERIPFWKMMRETFLLSITADAAMLAIAPIFLITAKNNLLLLPLMGTATFFVYQTAQDALRRAHEANHDSLTQLLNRRAFDAAIANAVESHGGVTPPAAVLLLDLDRFKEVNDRLGHQTGDHLLQAFARGLHDALPPDAVSARLGGDEFAVLLAHTYEDEAIACAERLLERLCQPLTVDGFPITIETSIGVAHAPEHGDTPTELMHAADVAMYRAKRDRSGVEVYRPSGSEVEVGRVTLLSEVGAALRDGDFVVEYQPQIDLAAGRIRAVEALLRWDHPTVGRIMPGKFIGLAENTDLIGPITEYVIRSALEDLRRLPDEVAMAVNVSARNLEDRHFADTVLEAVGASGVDPTRLELEVTEAALASDPERSEVVLGRLRATGIRLAIDDFGTGYSSFTTLQRHDVDTIKIDRSFTYDLADDTNAHIVRSLIDLAHHLGVEVVAEGVETRFAHGALRRFQCDVAQGYLYSGAIPLEQVLRECGPGGSNVLAALPTGGRFSTSPSPVSPAVTDLAGTAPRSAGAVSSDPPASAMSTSTWMTVRTDSLEVAKP